MTMPILSQAPETNISLLGRLGEFPANESAWKDFVHIYGRHIYNWAKKCGLQNDDAEEVTQLTLVRLAKAMRTFSYDPKLRFRAWLKTVSLRIWQDFLRGKQRSKLALVGEKYFLFHSEYESAFSQSIESAYETDILRKSMENVRLRVLPQTWDAFRMTAIEELPASEVASTLGVKLTTIYKAKSNILKLIQHEVEYLEETLR